MLCERDYRREDFREGTPVTLADGQEWHLPRPRLVLFPKVTTDGVEVASKRSLGEEYDALMDEFSESSDVAPLFRLACHLLGLNYDLPDEGYSELLTYEPDCPESRERWHRIVGVAMGASDDPKPSPVGDGPA